MADEQPNPNQFVPAINAGGTGTHRVRDSVGYESETQYVLEQQIKQLESALATERQKVKQLKTFLDTANDSLEERATVIDIATKRILYAEPRITELESELQHEQQKVKELTERLYAVNPRTV